MFLLVLLLCVFIMCVLQSRSSFLWLAAVDDFAVMHAIRVFHVRQKGLKLNGTNSFWFVLMYIL